MKFDKTKQYVCASRNCCAVLTSSFVEDDDGARWSTCTSTKCRARTCPSCSRCSCPECHSPVSLTAMTTWTTPDAIDDLVDMIVDIVDDKSTATKKMNKVVIRVTSDIWKTYAESKKSDNVGQSPLGADKAHIWP